MCAGVLCSEEIMLWDVGWIELRGFGMDLDLLFTYWWWWFHSDLGAWKRACGSLKDSAKTFLRRGI